MTFEKYQIGYQEWHRSKTNECGINLWSWSLRVNDKVDPSMYKIKWKNTVGNDIHHCVGLQVKLNHYTKNRFNLSGFMEMDLMARTPSNRKHWDKNGFGQARNHFLDDSPFVRIGALNTFFESDVEKLRDLNICSFEDANLISDWICDIGDDSSLKSKMSYLSRNNPHFFLFIQHTMTVILLETMSNNTVPIRLVNTMIMFLAYCLTHKAGRKLVFSSNVVMKNLWTWMDIASKCCENVYFRVCLISLMLNAGLFSILFFCF